MKRSLFLLFFLFIAIQHTLAQEFVVKSFEYKVSDAKAKIDPVYDLNGDPCALIRVAIAAKGCTFEGNIAKEPEAHPGEYLVYVPAGTRKLKILHPNYLPLTYEFNLKIEKNCTYELRIELPQNRPIVPELQSQFLVMSVSPQDATVLIDDVPQQLTNGQLSRELAFGIHTYHVNAPMHHSRMGSFTISDAGKTTLNIALNPAYGYIQVTSAPESGAQVYIDGLEAGKTPYKSDRLSSGTHQVQILKAGYYSQMQPVEVKDNQTTPIAFNLKANFATITLQAANPNAEIWVSGKLYGTGRWSGRLEAGSYSVESRCAGYEKTIEALTVEAGIAKTVQLQAQTPIYGILKVSSTPIGAKVLLDGKEIGETPLISNRILEGIHEVQIVMANYTPAKRTVKISPTTPADIKVDLASIFGTVMITSTPAAANVTIDGRSIGVTPCTSSNLKEGTYIIKISKPGYYSTTKSVVISQNKQSTLNVQLENEDAVYDKAIAAIKSCQAQAGINQLTTAAEAGNARSQYELGSCYYNGNGVVKNLAKGHYWMWKAAEQGYSAAKEFIGTSAPERKSEVFKYAGESKFRLFYAYPGIEMQFASAQPFSEGLALVKGVSSVSATGKVENDASRQYFYIDNKGNVIFEGFLSAEPFKDGVAKVIKDKKVYYMDHMGRETNKPASLYTPTPIQQAHNEQTPTSTKLHTSPTLYDSHVLNAHPEGEYQEYRQKNGLVSNHGRKIVACEWYYIKWEGLKKATEYGIEVRKDINDKIKIGLVDLTGNVIIPPKNNYLTLDQRKRAMEKYKLEENSNYTKHLQAAKLLKEEGVKD